MRNECTSLCSISGIWQLDGSTIEHERIQRFSASLKHRGPDGTGCYVDQAVGLALGATRLAIVDATPRGNQPMAYAQERYWLVFNGEIFNFVALRSELQQQGYEFLTDTDSEVLLAAYVCWGRACQERLNGMWAFAIWDRLTKTLFLSRDRFGVKPLYYTFDGRRFAFASEVKAFLALDGFNPTVNLPYQATAIATRHYQLAGEQTILQDVKRLAAGHSLLLSPDHPPRLTRWWNTLDHVAAVPKRFVDQVAAFQELFTDACRIQLRSALPIGVSLSGGMDSTSVLATAHQVIQRHKAHKNDTFNADLLRAYVATFSDELRDESRAAALLTDRLGIVAHHERVRPLISVDALDLMLFHTEDIHSLHPANWAICGAMKRDGVQVALTGDGGDELFASTSLHVELAIQETLQFPTQLLRYLRLKKLATEIMTDESVLPKAGADDSNEMLAGAELLRVDCLPMDNACLNADLHKLAPRQILARQLYFDFHYGSLPWVLHLKDMIAMAHGIEIRSPLLDWRVVCFAFALPSSSVVDGVATKRILREAMYGSLPESIRQRKRKNFFVSHEGSAFWQMRALVLETAYSHAFVTSPLWPGKRMQQLIEKCYRDHDDRYAAFLWRCIKATRLQEAFKSKVCTNA